MKHRIVEFDPGTAPEGFRERYLDFEDRMFRELEPEDPLPLREHRREAFGHPGPLGKAFHWVALGGIHGKEEVIVHNYWDDRPVLHVEPATVKWLVLSKPRSGEALVVLTNWSETDVTARVRGDSTQLRLNATRVTDHESGANLAESVASTIKVDLPGAWGNRILFVGQ